ncbi:MAG: transposase [Deltaproteobacteria bacterium]|nr:transposase [Deltaproteobacteria bacterium]
MPRPLRMTYPDIPHHIVQRGCKRSQIFFHHEDYEKYLSLLSEYCAIYGCRLWSYCLMPNHIHLTLIPNTEQSISKTIGLTHKRYSDYLNLRMGWKGTLWESRFRCYAMDDAHLYQVLKYIERNPVTALMVERPEDYIWSSTRYHLELTEKHPTQTLNPLWESAKQWSEYLEQPTQKEMQRLLAEHEISGKFLGNQTTL